MIFSAMVGVPGGDAVGVKEPFVVFVVALLISAVVGVVGDGALSIRSLCLKEVCLDGGVGGRGPSGGGKGDEGTD